MPLGRISLNIHAHGVRDRNALMSFLRQTDPVSVLVMDGVNLAAEIKAELPSSIVIHRTWPDGDLHYRMSPIQWLNQKAVEIGTSDLWCYTTNEPAFNSDLLRWHIDLIRENAKRPRPLKLVILNLAVGNPEPHQWREALELLRLLHQYRSWCILGLHEYAVGVPTSDFGGGNPSQADLIRPERWPRGAAMIAAKPPNGAMYHCGRFLVLNEICKANGITPPRIILTEHGFDSIGDQEQWANTLLKTSPYTSIRGWKSLQNQWSSWYPYWSPERTLFESMKYLSEELYRNTNVEAQLIFCWGWIDRQWEQYDVSEARVFQDMLIDYVKGLSMSNPPTELFHPKPVNAGTGELVIAQVKSNVRAGRGTAYTVRYTTNVNEEFVIYKSTAQFDALKKYEWIWVEPTDSKKFPGWVALVQPIDTMFVKASLPPDGPNNPDLYTADQLKSASHYLTWVRDNINSLLDSINRVK